MDHLTGERNIKTNCVLDYNNKMGAVEKADIINNSVACAQKTTKCYQNIFLHLIETDVLNGRIDHSQLTSEMITEQGFL